MSVKAPGLHGNNRTNMCVRSSARSWIRLAGTMQLNVFLKTQRRRDAKDAEANRQEGNPKLFGDAHSGTSAISAPLRLCVFQIKRST